jgi:hypothetical protein
VFLASKLGIGWHLLLSFELDKKTSTLYILRGCTKHLFAKETLAMNQLAPLSPRPFRPFLILAAGTLASAGLVAAAPGAVWVAFAAPLLLAFSLVAAEFAQRRRAGEAWRPSPGVLLMAAVILLSCGIVGASNPDQLVLMISILSSCAVFPLLDRPRGARSCGS